MHDSNDLKRGCVGAVNNGVGGIAGQGPETKWTAREIGPGMAAQGCLDNEGKCVENRLFYPVGRGFTVSRNVSPDFENIGFA